MSNVGYGTLQIIPSAKGFKALLDKEVNGPLGSVGDKEGKAAGGKFRSGILGSLKGIAGPIAALVAGTAVIDFFKDAVNGASDLSESTSKVGVVFKSSAAQILQASQTSAKGMGLSKEAYLAATGTLGNLLVSLDLAPQKAADMSQQMVKLAGDLASFNNVSPEEALDALKAGLTGEAEPLKKFGVNMNDATLKAQALKMGLIKSTKDALNPQTKALAAQALIMAQTKTAQGDFARTSGGLANQQRILAAQFLDVKAKVGGALLPIITTLVTFLNTKALPIFSEISGGVTAFASAFSNAGDGVTSSGFAGAMERVAIVARTAIDTIRAKVLPVLQEIGRKIISNVVPGVVGLVKAIAPLVVSAAKLALSIGSKVLPVVIKLATLIGGSILTGFKELGTFVGNNATTFQSLAVAIGAGLVVWKAFQLALATGAVIMKGIAIVTRAFAVAQGILNAVMALNPVLLVVIAIAALAAGLIYAYKHSETFRKIVNAVFSAVKDFVVGAVTAVKDAVVTAWNAIKSATSATWNAIKAAVNFVVNAVVAYVNGLRASVVAVWNAIKTATSATWNAIKTAVSAVIGFVVSYVTDRINLVKAVMSAVWTFIKSATSGAWNAIKTTVSGAIDGVVSTVSGIKKRITGAIGDLTGTLLSAGKDLARGFINGIGNLVGDAANKAKELANAAKDAITGALGIHSPSKVLTEVGVFAGQGFANGLKKSTGLVTAASQAMASAAIPRASLPIRSASNGGAITSAASQVGVGNDIDITVNGQNDPEATARIVGRKLADLGV
ncbi:hypothetical protein OG474_09660 [Kribbella sp. NBC_01505]|uniref:phage tail protein n=1 Tax=Kribbella sp. NBC_01505 TaxID=2903580 RepID=UPI0038704D70